MKSIKVMHILLNGIKCSACSTVIEAGSGVHVQVEGKNISLCDTCLSAVVHFREKLRRSLETKQIGNTFYAEGDTPPVGATGFVGRTVDPNTVYHAPPPEEPKEAPKYKPKIPPRRPSR